MAKRHCMGMGEPKLPVLILTGYLGAGKTTLLNYILHEQIGKRLAVIENEIGEVSVDDALVEQKTEDLAEELVVLDNGCVCCTIRGDLLKALQGFVEKVRGGGLKLDGILMELTGAADPAPVVQTFMLDDSVRATFYIDNVITLVDAKHAIQKLDETKGDNQSAVCAQIAFSSTVLLNKVDLVDQQTVDMVEKRVKQLNGSVEIIRCEQARVPLDKLFNVCAFDLARVLEEQYMDEEEFNNFYQPKMDNTISNVGLKFTGALNMFQFQMLLNDLIGDEESAKNFMRIKGVLHIQGSQQMFVMQCVHMLRNQSFSKPWATDAPESRLIFIGRGMAQRRKELMEAVMACVAKPLRFEVGAKVQAKVGCGEDGWLGGTIIKQWDECRAYRVGTDDGGEVWAPIDSDDFVRPAGKN
eukprot:CAMPEP_0176083242 /NCGR_PEP_ID=MMETSP0120_2-20121206/41645_1 /TAXON_ID=160619 /ORGANISM="Kryptoperidinium foliaceum, Strain CCMP 1326" /LENGTH=411 /DNA_ID=CAMNT_0017417023 /DNA_START=18 /DNA_END=1253 /DNA_ORIENTATION=+